MRRCTSITTAIRFATHTFGVIILGALPASADIFELKTGGQIEGQLLADTLSHYQIRTYIGQIELAKDKVAKYESSPSIFETYDRRVAQLDNTPDALVELAAWCADHDLSREHQLHLDQALAINPNHTGARAALGYTQVGDLWIESETVLETQAKRYQAVQRAQREAQREFAAALATLEQNVRRIEGRYFIGRARQRDVGYDELKNLVAADPLAIDAVFNVLIRSRKDAFRDTVATLFAQIQGQHTTEYLTVMALEDRDDVIRDRAAGILLQRDAKLVIPILTRALDESAADIQNRAARLLSKMKAETAIPTLIELLIGQRQKWVERAEVDRPITVLRSFNTYIGRCNQPIAIVDQLQPINTFRSVYRRETVPVYRTPIRDALVHMTGEDFGFDQAAWSAWYEARGGNTVTP